MAATPVKTIPCLNMSTTQLQETRHGPEKCCVTRC